MPRLRRTSPDQPGWSRVPHGKGFRYLDERGAALAPAERQRVVDLVIPPAWREVWVTPYENGHLQAVGTDDAGRRQYLYHPDWTASRSRQKFDRMPAFGRALMRAREQVLLDLALPRMPLDRACAVAVRLLDLGYFRIGNDLYADTHGSFGLTTLERRHVRASRQLLVFSFTGKSAVEHRIEIDDTEVIEAIALMRRRRTPDDPSLLAYQEKRRWRSIAATHVNTYVGERTGIEATAKDFRTWHATVLAATALADSEEPGESEASRKRAISAAVKEVAGYLGNTPTLARTSYIHPGVIDAYGEGRTIRGTTRRHHPDVATRQTALERATLRLLSG